MNYETTGTSKYIYLGSSQKVWKCGSALTLTQNDIDSKVSFYSDADVQTNSAIITNFQIERGSIATSYTPYIEDIEQVKVLALGKNVIDNNKFFNADNWINCGDIGGSRKNGDYPLNLLGDTQYTLTWNYKETTPKYFYLISADKGKPLVYEEFKTEKYLCGVGDAVFAHTFKTDSTKDYYLFLGDYVDCLENRISYIQVEVGATATEYEPYKEPVEYKQGEPIKPIYPTINITTDTVGAIVDVEYNKDINKALAELTSALISLGANV